MCILSQNFYHHLLVVEGDIYKLVTANKMVQHRHCLGGANTNILIMKRWNRLSAHADHVVVHVAAMQGNTTIISEMQGHKCQSRDFLIISCFSTFY